MQRYRINYRLLIGLFVGSILLSVTLHFVWKLQVNWRADWYRDESQVAMQAGNQLKAFDYLKKFVRLRKKDEQARIELASIAADVAVMDGIKREEKGAALGVLSDTVRRTNDAGLRRKLADLQFLHGSPKDAIAQLKELLKVSDDPELHALHVRSLFRAKDYNQAIDLAFELIGYDKLAKAFDTEKAVAADQPELYSALAQALLQEKKNPELARQVIDQMAALNPDSAIAHLRRSIFLHHQDEKEEAAKELDKALQLDPQDEEVLYRNAEVNLSEENYEEARRFARQGIEIYPEAMQFYQLLASIELGSKQYDEALAVLDKGIQEFGEDRAINFTLFKIDIMLSKDDTASIEAIIRDLEKLENPRLQPLIEYQRARVKFHRGQWFEASKLLAEVRPQLAVFGRTQAIAGVMLAEAYEKLGKLDLARQVYDIVLNDETLSTGDSIKRSARSKFQQINKRVGLGGGSNDDSLTSLIQQMRDKPEEDQNWQEIDDFIDKVVETRGLSEVQEKLLKAQVFTQREMLPEAKQLIREAARLDPQDVGVRLAAARLLMMEPTTGPPKALGLLRKIEKDFEASLMSRALMADAIMSISGEEVKQQLRDLLEGIEDWSNSDRVKLQATVGIKFLQLNDAEEAVEYLSEAAQSDPGNLPLRIQLFEIAYQQRDDAAMRKAQEGILELVGSKEDSNYIFTEVKRRLINFQGDEESRIQLQEARRMLEDVLEKRPQWHELHVLYAQVLLTLKDDMDLALTHLNDALKFGRPTPNAIGLLVKLLVARGDLQQAQEKMELIPEASRGSILGQVEAAILLANKELESAFESARKVAQQRPENAQTQAWFAEIAEKTKYLDESARAYRQACELNPSNHNVWMKLVGLHAQRKDFVAMEAALRDAQLALEPQYLPLLQAKFFEMQNQWKSAEGIYLTLFQDRLDEPASVQQLAQFYLLWALKDDGAVRKAAPYLNRLLRAANEGKLKHDNPNVLWARERAARILASAGNYRDSVRAQRMLEQLSPDGKVPENYQTLYGKILSSRSDPISLLAAIDELSALNRRGLLNKEQLLLLAKLYARTNNWDKGKPLMLDALGRYGSDPKVWSTYIALLIGRGEYKTASQRLSRFAEITSDKTLVFRLRTQLAFERGDQAEVRKLLQSMLPPNLSPTTPLEESQLNMLRAVAAMAVQYEEYELAEQWLRLYTARKSDGVFDLLTVIALHGNADQALPIMEKLAVENPDPVAQLAVQMIRQRRAEFGDRFDDAVSQLVLSVWEDDPDLTNRLVMRAEMYEVMEKYDEAIRAYEDIVDRDDLSPMAVAAASNNLAYLLALRNQQLDTAQEQIDRAIEILGPLADVLDTRAVIRMARKEFDLAVEDMTLSLSIDPTAVKYYHMARAQALAGNEEEALDAWQKANEMEIEMDSLPLIEQPGYRETEQLIEKLSSESTRLTNSN